MKGPSLKVSDKRSLYFLSDESYGKGERKVRQPGKTKRKTWRKIYLSICPDSHEIIFK
ncbi:hypothetical protein NEOC84_000099|nr:hypothetical protein [Neochlamydia sp. AcF84]